MNFEYFMKLFTGGMTLAFVFLSCCEKPNESQSFHAGIICAILCISYSITNNNTPR